MRYIRHYREGQCVLNKTRKLNMKTQQGVTRLLVLSSALALAWAGSLHAAPATETAPGVPNIFNPAESDFQNQTHFLVFTGSDSAGENAKTAKAYYDAIDPSRSKRTFTSWLKNAGFISDESQWHSTGAQKVACDLPGCDLPSHQPDGSLTYGDNILNTYSHAIVLNGADLGFVRNQYIRCIPNCQATNPKIYTYLENYPVNPFAASGNGGSGFPTKTGYPTEAESAAAIQSALNRPLDKNLVGCDPAKTDTVFGCKIDRIADVAFEWAPPPTDPSSSTRYGTTWAFLYNNDGAGNITETIADPVARNAPNVHTGVIEPTVAGDPFAPNLDFIGNKTHPGVCLICHGGNPKNLTSTGVYPAQGNIDGFRFLPLDIRNLLFTSDSGSEQPALPTSAAFTSRANQELHVKAYNLAVLKTVTPRLQTDPQGVKRVAHLKEVIDGWYANGRATQDTEFIPVGWREPVDGGTAPPGSKHLYETVFSPACRSCHFNRAIDLDFGTARGFLAEKSNVAELALLPLCQENNPEPGKRPMALAHLTYQRFWQANVNAQSLPFPKPDLTLFQTAEELANYLGFSGTKGYCASKH